MDLTPKTIKHRVYHEFLPSLRKNRVNLTYGGHYIVGKNGYTQDTFDAYQTRIESETEFDIDQIIKVVPLILKHMKPRKTYNRNSYDSYGLKGVFERMQSSYISNGNFILAMMVCGFFPLFKQTRTKISCDPNCIFKATFQKNPLPVEKRKKPEQSTQSSPTEDKSSDVKPKQTTKRSRK